MPQCYTNLFEGEKSLADRLTVSLLVNKLMTGGELVKGMMKDLKPSTRSAIVGNSRKRAMNVDDCNFGNGNR